MARSKARRKASLPLHWVGVRADWPFRSGPPSESLVSVTPEDLRTHALVLGATGSGKTNLLHHLVAQDVLLGHSFVVLDLRGDLVEAVLRLCAGRVPPSWVKVIDLREKVRPFGFNPLKGAGEPYFHALNVLAVIQAESDGWGTQFPETMRYGLVALSEAGEDLTGLERLFYEPAFRRRVLAQAVSEDAVAFWRRYDGLSAEKQGSLASPVMNKVSLLLATRSLRRVLGHPDPIDLGAHLDEPRSVLLVSLAVDELQAAGRMVGSMVLGSICREVLGRVQTPEAQRNPVRLYVDEFQNFGGESFEAVLSEGRRFGLSLCLAHQTLGQLSPKMRGLILGNVGTKFIFGCGRDDASAMSKDLTGSLDAIDFTVLPTGHAALWRRKQGLEGIEVNLPLFSGWRADDGLDEYLDEVYAGAAGAPGAGPIDVCPSPDPEVETSQLPKSQVLEDWL